MLILENVVEDKEKQHMDIYGNIQSPCNRVICYIIIPEYPRILNIEKCMETWGGIGYT